jgi:hypothetical protein
MADKHSDPLSVVVLWHSAQACDRPDPYGCPGHSALVTPMERAGFQRQNWRLSCGLRLVAGGRKAA